MANKTNKRASGVKVANIKKKNSKRDVRVIVDPEIEVAKQALSEKEKQARVATRKFATTTSGNLGGGMNKFAFGGGDVSMSSQGNFYSPQLSTDFLEKPQNLRERRAWYRHFYHSNEYVGNAIDLHSSIPLSKIRLTRPKTENEHLGNYVYDFFEDMCSRVGLFKSLLEISHEYWLFGNCLVKGTRVPTSEGLKLVEDVKIGDLVLTHKGRYRRVVKSVSRGTEGYRAFSFHKYNRMLNITGEHPLEVLRDGVFSFEEAENVNKGDFVRLSRAETDTGIAVPDFLEISSDRGDFKKQEGGYSLTTRISRKRTEEAYRVRNSLIQWLEDLENPTVKTRKELCEEIGCEPSVLNNVIITLDAESKSFFHKRVGATGYQKGSAVEWYPVEKGYFSKEDHYEITRESFFSSPEKIEIDEDLLYLLGYWLGDGTLGTDYKRDSVRRGMWKVYFGESSVEQYEKIKRILINMLGIGCVREQTSRSMKILSVSGNPVFKEVWSNNFGRSASHETDPKTIPSWIKYLPKEKLSHFLAGIIDSDGYITKEDKTLVGVTLSSEQLIHGIWEVALRCGVVFNYSENNVRTARLPDGRVLNGVNTYSLITRDEQSCKLLSEHSIKKLPENPVFSKDSGNMFVRVGDDVAFKIKDVKDVEEAATVYNFEVEEDHTYGAEIFSTHNCFIFAEEHDPYQKNDSDPESHIEVEKRKQLGEQRAKKLFEEFKITDKDPNYMGWDRLVILPPDQVRLEKAPFADRPNIEYIPDSKTSEMIVDSQAGLVQEGNQGGLKVPQNIVEAVSEGGSIPLDTDPYSGSYCYHLARKKSQYETMGVSILERCVNTLLYWDKIRQAQTSIASRHMTPIRIVWAEELSDYDVEELRAQVDMALVDPDFSIIANYQVNWEEMGSNGRLLEVSTEYQIVQDALFAGLGVTREILTGEGVYSGNRISLEILNTHYMLFRELLQEYVEENLFKPVAVKKGFVETDKYGRKKVIYPKLSFTRLAIKDNDSYFDQVMQLYNKGSVSIDVILDMLNIDPDSTKKKIESDMFGVNDAAFQDMMRSLYGAAGNQLLTDSNVMSIIAQKAGLTLAEPSEEGGGDGGFDLGGGGGARFASTGGTSEKITKATEKIAELLANNPDKLEEITKQLGL
jgi:intein/homing endonuclease